MTETVLAPLTRPPDVVDHVRPPEVLIPVQQVALGTAAAVALPRQRSTHRFLTAIRAVFVSSATDPPPEKRHYAPRRGAFMEHAAMAREMHRL